MFFFLLNSHFLFSNLSRGSGFSQAELLPREGATHTLLARRLPDENAKQRLHYEKDWSCLNVEENKENAANAHIKLFFSSKKCDADDVKQPLVASIETQLCRTSDTIGMLTQFNCPHLQENVRVGEHSVKFLCAFKRSF